MWPHLCDIELADPDPSSQYPIHMLIGSNLFASILVPEPTRLDPTHPRPKKPFLAGSFLALQA
jgi:hypothetical protein